MRPSPMRRAIRLDIGEVLSVHPGRAAIAAHPPVGFGEKVLTPYLVDQRMEAPSGFFLRFRM